MSVFDFVKNMTFLIILTLCSIHSNCQTTAKPNSQGNSKVGYSDNSSPNVTKEQAYLYFLKSNQYKPEDIKVTGEGQSQNFVDYETWTQAYLLQFDVANYKSVVDDEFKYNGLIKSTNENLMKKINELSFDKTFLQANTNLSFGEYDFTINSFPIKFDQDNNTSFSLAVKIPFDNVSSKGTQKLWDHGAKFMKLFFTNTDAFDFRLPMPQNEAQEFIENRKAPTGAINRNITAKIVYKFQDTKMDRNNNSFYFVPCQIVSIEIWGRSPSGIGKLCDIKRKG